MTIADLISNPLYRFTKEESMVLRVLSAQNNATASGLSRVLKVPRMTLYTHITSLLDRGLIEKNSEGRKMLLSLNSEFIVHHTKTIQDGDTSQFKQSSNSTKSIQILGSSEEMLIELQKFYNQKNVRFHAVQSTNALLELVRAYGAETFIPINNAIKRNKNVFETLVNEEALDEYLKMYKKDSKTQNDLLDSFYGRMNDTTYVKATMLNSIADIAFTEQECIVYNWKRGIGILIKDKDIIQLIKNLFGMAKLYGKKEDLNQKLADKIKFLKSS